jgi:hypothetical protein
VYFAIIFWVIEHECIHSIAKDEPGKYRQRLGACGQEGPHDAEGTLQAH